MYALQHNGWESAGPTVAISGRSHRVRHPFRTLNIPSDQAAEILEQVRFAEECLRQGLPGMACDVLAELSAASNNSPSLLLKILLSELLGQISRPGPLASQLAALDALKIKVWSRCRQGGDKKNM
jgi:hypothetical protein